MEIENTSIDIGWNGYLTLVRHGETTYNVDNRFVGVSDPPLTDRGIQQAREGAEYLSNWAKKQDITFDIVLSSPLKRCIDTARIFSERFNLQIISEDLLKERNYGIFEGVKHSDAQKLYPDLLAKYMEEKPFVELPNGETAYDVENRIRMLLKMVIPKNYSKNHEILIISHLNPIRAIFHILGLTDWSIYFKQFQNTSISRIKIEQNKKSFEFCDKCPVLD